MSSTIKDLTEAIKAKNEPKIIEILTKQLEAQTSENIELENNFIPSQLIALNNDKITKLFVKIAAEWCKTEINRKQFTNLQNVSFLLKQLEESREEGEIISAVRALGNICYDNEHARKLFDDKALASIISILKEDKNRKSSTLTVKVAGFMLNLLNSNEELLKSALKQDLLAIIESILARYLVNFSENQMLFAFLLQILADIVDYIDELNLPFSESLCCLLIEILQISSTPDTSVICLNILHEQAEKEEIKQLLASKGVCQLVFELIEKYRNQVNDEDSRNVMKNACDIIVSILTGEECMILLYDNGKGQIYKNMLSWLDSDDTDLLSTGVLALGNFARKDLHCIQMVNDGVSEKLIKLLSKHNTSSADEKVQHALLSTLKNLAIPPENKPKILSQNLIETMYPITEFDQYPVIFKLLGTFRMVIDGQPAAALDLISRPDFIEKLMHWCYNSDHLGIRGEIPRLLAWLIKHCRSFVPFRRLIEAKDSVKCLVEMVASNHAVMQNESLYALNLLCVGCAAVCCNSNGVNGVEAANNAALFEQLVEAEVGKNVSFVTNKYGDKFDKHTIENLVTLLEQLVVRSGNAGLLMATHLRESGVGEVLAKLAGNSNCSGDLSERLDVIKQQLNTNI